MPNYKIEGNIDFYDTLYKSLDYDSSEETDINNKKKICEITGNVLCDRYVTMECGHTFNYDALYTEIYKQKCEFKSYTTDVLSKSNLQKIRDNRKDYYIKCPYCRNVQFELLPYYADLQFTKIYGINTNDPAFRPTNTFNSGAHFFNDHDKLFTSYGYKFTSNKGKYCCDYNAITGISLPVCTSLYTTDVTAPDDSIKKICPQHIRPIVKNYKVEIKKKEIQEKLLAKAEAKQKKLEAKQKASEEKQKAKEEMKKKKEDNVEATNVYFCTAILKTGSRKGETCGIKAGETNLCKRHSK
jgi:hypothetical protein